MGKPDSYKHVADQVAAVADELKLCARCEVQGGKNKPRKVYPGFGKCWGHMSRSERAISKRGDNLNTKLGSQYGFYIRHVSSAIQLIRTQAELAGERGKLYTTDLSEELSLGRLLLVRWLNVHEGDPDLPLKDLLACIETISKISLTARKIAELDDAGLKEDQLRAIVTSISHAFHKANLAPTAETRATIFASECASIFGGRDSSFDHASVPATIEGNFTRVD